MPRDGRRLTPAAIRKIALVMVFLVVLVGGYALINHKDGAVQDVGETPGYTAPPAMVLNLGTFTPPKVVHALFIGDSFTEGYPASSPSKGWAPLTAAALGWKNPRIDGVGGSGFTNATPSKKDTFLDRINGRDHGVKANVVILEGGLNDYKTGDATEAKAVRATITAARKVYGNPQILVFDDWTSPAGRDGALRYTARVDEVAHAMQVRSIDPVRDSWIDNTNASQYLYKDNSYPNGDVGHAYYAARAVAAIRAVTAISPASPDPDASPSADSGT